MADLDINLGNCLKTMNPKIGDVWTLPGISEVPQRILAMDQLEVLFDWEAQGAPKEWMIGTNAKRKTGYLRLPVAFLKAKGRCHRVEPLTEAERAFHRPDLPLRAFRTKSIAWGRDSNLSAEEIRERLRDARDVGGADFRIPCERIMICPVKPSGVFVRPVLVVAEEPAGVSGVQFVMMLQSIQAKFWRKPSNGIGLYRSGMHNGIPDYYAGEYYDRAGIIPKSE